MSRIGSLRRRGIAVAIVASGNYLAGAIWPPIVQHAIATIGWRQTHLGIGVLCLVTMLPLACLLRRRSQLDTGRLRGATAAGQPPAGCRRPRCRFCWSSPASPAASPCRCRRCTSSPIAAISATAPARGAEMLSIMLGIGVVSRLASGFIADRIGGAGTLLLGSTLQCLPCSSTCPSTA